MRFSTVAAALLPVASVLAADWPVKVGDTGLDFNPSSVMAAPGDTLTFQFVAKNHSVTQSTFTAPCTPMNATSIDSGFMPISDPGQVLNFTVTVNDTNPVWFYCKQVLNGVSHCESGMVFALNPTANKTFAAFQGAAKALNATGNSTASNTSSSSGSAPSPTSSSKPNGALKAGTTAAMLLSALGLVAGVML